MSFLRLKNFLDILKDPYTEQQKTPYYQSFSGSDKKYKTFCGT